MDTLKYNDYVLQASLEAQWITETEHRQAAAAVSGNGGTSALDWMQEHQMLSPEQAQTLLDLIHQAETHNSGAQHTGVIEIGDDPGDSRPDITGTAIYQYLHQAVDSGASDLHLGPDFPPHYRIGGNLTAIDPSAPRLTPEDTEALARQFLRPSQIKQIEEIGSIEFCYEVPSLARFRTSVVRQRRGWESVFRIIETRVRTMEELGLPPVFHDLIKYHNGLILVTGPVGSGKTTTLASMVHQINMERRDHIITLEDPIEYVFEPAGCQITQREVHSHTDSFATALRAALRQDPDVIMVGEMRDLETISLAITASETGHLVLATLHTSNAARTMQRLLDVFPVEQQAQIRTMVSESLRGVISQQLVPRADGNGRALALEIMTNTPAIGNLIREGKNFMIPGQMQTGRKQGMRLMDDSLLELVSQKIITPEEAYQRSDNKKGFAQSLASIR